MGSGVVVGAGAGLVGGVVGAGVLSILGIKGHEGEITRAILLVSRAVRSDSLVVGWLVQIGAAAVIGALFGALYTACRLRRESAAWWATVYGIAWWILGWFAVMPSPLRDAPWAAVRDPALFQLAVAGLLACLSYGAALGGAFTLFGRAGAGRSDERARAARAAALSSGASSPARRESARVGARRAGFDTREERDGKWRQQGGNAHGTL
jgi:hypothetical protein